MSAAAGAAGRGPYRINVAAELSGVAPATLRAWERRYGVPEPQRTTTAYRLYSQEDVALIARMRQLVESGIAPAEAAKALRAVAATPSPSVEDAPQNRPASSHEGLASARERLLSATERWDARGIDEELTRLSFLVDPVTLYAEVISPLLVDVGQRWERGELSIAQEHLLSEKIELVLRGALKALDRPDAPLVLMATIAGDPHVLGLLGAALSVVGAGARVVVLGASTPPEAIADAVERMRPRFVGLSATLMPKDPEALLARYGAACAAIPWCLGGAVAVTLAPSVERFGGVPIEGLMASWGSRLRSWLRSAP